MSVLSRYLLATQRCSFMKFLLKPLMFSFPVEASLCLFFSLLFMVLGPNPRLRVCQVSALPLNRVPSFSTPFLLIPKTSLYIVDVSPLLDACVVNITLQVCMCVFLPAFLSFSLFLSFLVNMVCRHCLPCGGQRSRSGVYLYSFSLCLWR